MADAGNDTDLLHDDVSPSRRTFLRWISGLGASVSGVLVAFPTLRAFFTPALAKPTPSSWVKVAEDVALLDIGVPIPVSYTTTRADAWVESRSQNSLWLYTDDGEKFKAYNGHCTHLGCGFDYDKETRTFICPCHQAQFDVKTGAVLRGPPPRPLDELNVEVRDGSVFVDYKNFRLGVPERVEV